MSVLRSYLVRILLRGYLAVALAMASLVGVLELLQRLEDLGRPGVRLVDLVLQALLQVPENLVDLVPVITVVATAAVFGGLQAHRELTVMRASGVSLWALTRIAMIPGLGVVLAALLALQWLTPLFHEGPERITGTGLGETSLWHPWHGLWVRKGNEFLNVRHIELGRIPADISILSFARDGRLERQVTAERALIEPGQIWKLEGARVREFDAEGKRALDEHPELEWESFLSSRQLDLLLRPPAALPLTDLWRYLEGLRARGQEVAEFELVFWRRLALPLAGLGMVLAAMAVAAAPLRTRVVSLRVSLAVAIGLAYLLLEGMAGFAGLVLNVTPVMIAFGPPIVLSLFAWWLLASAR